MDDKQELIDIIETVYRGASKGRGLVVSPKGKFRALLCRQTHAPKLTQLDFRLFNTLSLLGCAVSILGDGKDNGSRRAP